MDQNILVRFYRLLLRLYPQEHRRVFSSEMVGVFKQSLADARHEGSAAVVTLCLRELLFLPAGLAQAYAQSWRQWQPALVRAPGIPWALGWAAGTTAAIPLAYFLMVPLAGAFLLLLRFVNAGTIVGPDVLRALAFLLAVALLVAVLQWALLRRHLPGAGWWFGATFAGWSLAGVLLVVILAFVTRLNVTPPPWVWMVVPLTLGFSTGILQMLVLRRITPHAIWWLPVTVLAFGAIILSGDTIGSISELFFIMSLPGAISAAGLWLLLRQAARQPNRANQVAASEKKSWRQRPALLALLGISVLAFSIFTPWAYAVGQIELAKSEGIYASPEEAIMARQSQGWGGARVVSIENVQAGPNRHDGSMDHVWFGGAQITLDRIPAGGRHSSYNTGSFYLRLRDGWVHMPEGAFPQLVGWLMEVYHLEGQ